MRKPSFQQPRSTSMPYSLSRKLPKLRFPPPPLRATPAAHPKVGRVGTVVQPRTVRAKKT